MTPKMIFGIDVGTRTTVVSFWNVPQGVRGEMKVGSDDRIRSLYLRGDPGIPQPPDDPDAHLHGADAVTDFKIRFWKTDAPGADEQRDLQGWLARLYGTIAAEYPIEMEHAAFCFTYPAQRNALEPLFRKLIGESGFPLECVVFLDEPTAAVYAQVASEERLPLGKGLIIDVGAGTTDFTLVELRGADAGMVVLDSSSISVAGNYFTRGLRGLLPEESRAAFDRLVRDNPFRADRYKENVSNYYNDPENASEPFSNRIAEVGRVQSPDLEAFAATVEDEWAAMSSAISERLKARGMDDGDLQFVIPCGGGALHTGLGVHLAARFGSKLVPARAPQLLVARGAALFAKARFASTGTAVVPVSHELDRDVYVEFPEDARHGPVYLLRKGRTIPLRQALGGAETVRLHSNFFLPEGPVYVKVGELGKELGWLNINWYQHDQTGDHPGTVEWEFKPETGELTVKLKLDHVEADGVNKVMVGTLTEIVAMPGSYTRV